MRKILLLAIACSLALSGLALPAAEAASDHDGQIVKMEGLSTLYYVMDGKRYVFPNEKTYASWFTGFDQVTTLGEAEIYALPLAGNVKYRPGVAMVKITTDPKVYAVGRNGLLRWVKTEALAKKLYGDNWNLLVDDVPDSFFTNYTVGEAIDDEADYDSDQEVADNDTVEAGHGLQLGHTKRERVRATTGKCRAIPATPAQPGKKNASGQTIPATPATPARECKAQDDGDDDSDDIAPAISAVSASAGATTAAITWTTDEASDSKATYATSTLASAVLKYTASDTATTTAHLLSLQDLLATTTYYYIVESKDLAGNIGRSAELTFKTTD